MSGKQEYSAKDIEVLEGLEPVRKRPGMYIGGTDEHAYHHLVAEVLDNAMDEAVAGYANYISIELVDDHTVIVQDNGRGIPVDPHPKFPKKSALEVILTTLHSGGKFSDKVYQTAGGLHGVGISVVNALSQNLTVEVARENKLYQQTFKQGMPQGQLKKVGDTNTQGTTVMFQPDPEIFGTKMRFKPMILYRMVRSKAFLFKGVKMKWICNPALITEDMGIPATTEVHFPKGLEDFLNEVVKNSKLVIPKIFAGQGKLADNQGRIEWAMTWDSQEDGFFNSYCNTVPTPEGGTHETGLKMALTRSLKNYADLTGNKKMGQVTSEDILSGACVVLSIFIKDPQFQGQTKEKLSSSHATKLVDNAIKDYIDHWLTSDTQSANALLDHIIERAEERQRAKKTKELSRKSATKRLRLPGKLADCTKKDAVGTELFLVEGDSAGGSAKQARSREMQAILPLRGKILNVASATFDKLMANQELKDIIEALGCGIGKDYDGEKLRYEKLIIMTDADVDGAHIASLLMTFFYKQMPKLIEEGHLYLACPPLYRISYKGEGVYAMTDKEKDDVIAKDFKGKKVEVSRFKGLGEMPPQQLKNTTMDPKKRSLLRVMLPSGHTEEGLEDARRTEDLVEQLMGRKAEYRFKFIQEHAKFVENIDI